jgi:DHA1 family bicyclomycin/chloramphenicol resistance-like MFS transporter
MELIEVVTEGQSGKVFVARSKTANFFLLLFLGTLNTITPISIDMYLPAFPKIAASLHTGIREVSLSVSIYFLGFALGQILYGPLLDRYGRKRPLYAGLSLYIVSTISCAWSPSIAFLLVIRFVQALGGSAAAIAAMAMVLDFFPPEKSSRIISTLILIIGVSPMLAPTVGTLILAAWSWPYIFICLALVTLTLLLISIFYLPEGQEPNPSISLHPSTIIRSFWSISKDRNFYTYALAGTFSFAALFVYVSNSPAVFMGEFHVGPRNYSAIFAGLSIGFIGSSQLNHLLARHFRNEQILKAVVWVQAISSIIFFIFALQGIMSLSLVIGFLFVILACCGLSYPNAAAIALAPFTRTAGTASALLGFIQIGIGGLISTVSGSLSLRGSLDLSCFMAITSVLAVILLIAGRKRYR